MLNDKLPKEKKDVFISSNTIYQKMKETKKNLPDIEIDEDKLKDLFAAKK